MNEIQWKAFALIVKALTILFHMVGATNSSVARWEADVKSFMEGGTIAK